MTWWSFNFVKFLVHHPCHCFFPLPRQLHSILKPCSASVKCTELITIFLCKLEIGRGCQTYGYGDIPKNKKKSKIYKYRNSTHGKNTTNPQVWTLIFTVAILILNNSKFSVNIPACLDMDLACSKGLHPVRNTTTGVPRFWPYFVQNRTGLAPKSFKNLSGLANTLW